METEMAVLVRQAQAGRHTVTDGTIDYVLQSQERLNKLDIVKLTGELSGNVIVPSSIESMGTPPLQKAVELLGISANEWNPIVKSPVLEKCRHSIERMAKTIKFLSIANPKMIMRFHGDADGISAAIMLSRIIGGFKIQQNSAVYSNKDAFNDISQLRYEPYSCVFLIDCCTNEESMEALDLVKSAGINIVAIDHHPCPKGIGMMGTILNPWLDDPEEDASKFTAGYLACEASRMAGTDTSDMIGVSLAGDKSAIMPITDKDREMALVFDFVASYSSFGNRLELYRDLSKDEALFKSILSKAREHMEEVSAAISFAMKKEKLDNGITLVTVNLDKVAKRSEFPSRGKMATRAYEMAGEGNAVVVGYSEKSIILRVGHEAFEKGVKANELVKSVASECKGGASGGGHARAAAMLFTGLPADYLVSEFRKRIAEVK
jgi:RecJ-like exonuclease